MSVAISACIIFFLAILLTGADWDSAMGLSTGPIALYTLFRVMSRKDAVIGGELDQPARRWLEDLFSAAVGGLFYTGAVILCLAALYFVPLQRDEMPLELVPLVAAHFVPHVIFIFKQNISARR